MKNFKVTLYDGEKKLSYSYMEFAKSAKEAKEKAKSKTKNQVISARAI